MARAKMIVKRKVRASSMLEVIVAMVIIVLAFGLAMVIFAKVTARSVSGKQLRAEAILRKELAEGLKTGSWTQETIDTAGFRVEKEVSAVGADTALWKISLSAFDGNNNKVGELQQLVAR